MLLFSNLILFWQLLVTVCGFSISKVTPREIVAVEGQSFSVTCTSDDWYEVGITIITPSTQTLHHFPVLYLQTREQGVRGRLEIRGEQRHIWGVRRLQWKSPVQGEYLLSPPRHPSV